jgi:hypothetical protein
MGNRRNEFAFGDIGGDGFNAAELRPKTVAKSREIGHVLLGVEKSIGVNSPGEQARAISVVGGVKDWEESDGASVNNDLSQ